MILMTANPWKHPASGLYWFRRRVPEELRVLVGKREERFSLGTREPAEAKRRHALKAAEVEQRWANLRLGPQKLGWEEAVQLGGTVAAQWSQQLAADPHQSLFWDTTVGSLLWKSAPGAKGSFYTDALETLDPAIRRQGELEGWCKQAADSLLKDRGSDPSPENVVTLAKAISISMQRAANEHHEYLEGRSNRSTTFFSATPNVARLTSKSVDLEKVVSGWATEKNPNKKTLYTWRRVVGELAKFVGHTDATSITPDNLVAWKADLLAKNLKAKTIRDGKLAPVRAIFQWGVDNRLLRENPAHRITIDLKARSSEKIRGFTDEEAIKILAAARKEKDPVRRWVPWLCAYSGARVSEVCQLRKEDIKKIDGIWCVAFAAEAGSLKNVNSERVVPLHPAIEGEGFLKYVSSSAVGPLFSALSPDRFGSRGGNGTKVLSRWVRSLGLDDLRLSPNHSWRHRIKTQGRRHGLASDLLDAMTGHGRKTVADTYGEFPPEAMLRELCKIPTLNVM